MLDDYSQFEPTNVLDFWFPADGHQNDVDNHRQFWMWRMMGGAHQDIIDQFSDLAKAAAMGLLDHWAQTPRGRVVLIVTLDQFSRSVWAGTPAAFSQDMKATNLALEGMDNGHFAALEFVWEKNFYLIAIGHCEGPDHLARYVKLIECADQICA